VRYFAQKFIDSMDLSVTLVYPDALGLGNAAKVPIFVQFPSILNHAFADLAPRFVTHQ
jgi:hypothetical protein